MGKPNGKIYRKDSGGTSAESLAYGETAIFFRRGPET